MSGFVFQAEDGIRDAQESRGLGDVYKRQALDHPAKHFARAVVHVGEDGLRACHRLRVSGLHPPPVVAYVAAVQRNCLLYTSDAADDLLCVDLGGRRNIKKKNQQQHTQRLTPMQQPELRRHISCR